MFRALWLNIVFLVSFLFKQKNNLKKIKEYNLKFYKIFCFLKFSVIIIRFLVAAPCQSQQNFNQSSSVVSSTRQKSLNMGTGYYMPNIPTSSIAETSLINKRGSSPETLSNNAFLSSATSSANTLLATASTAYTTATTLSSLQQQQSNVLMATPTAPREILANNVVLQQNNSIKSISKILGVCFYYIKF